MFDVGSANEVGFRAEDGVSMGCFGGGKRRCAWVFGTGKGGGLMGEFGKRGVGRRVYRVWGSLLWHDRAASALLDGAGHTIRAGDGGVLTNVCSAHGTNMFAFGILG